MTSLGPYSAPLPFRWGQTTDEIWHGRNHAALTPSSGIAFNILTGNYTGLSN